MYLSPCIACIMMDTGLVTCSYSWENSTKQIRLQDIKRIRVLCPLNNVRFNGAEGRHTARNQVERVQGTVPKASSSSLPQAPYWPCPFKSWRKEVSWSLSPEINVCLASSFFPQNIPSSHSPQDFAQGIPSSGPQRLPKASNSSCRTPTSFLFPI